MRENRHPAGAIEGHIPALRRYARALIGWDCPDPAARADEMVRAVVDRARSKGQLGAFQDPQIWLYATLTARNRARSAAAASHPSLARPRAPGLPTAVAQLALEEREALLLVVVEGFSYGQAASILGLSRPGVASRVARARQHLARGAQATPSGQNQPRPRHPPYLRLVK